MSPLGTPQRTDYHDVAFGHGFRIKDLAHATLTSDDGIHDALSFELGLCVEQCPFHRLALCLPFDNAHTGNGNCTNPANQVP